MFKKVFLSMLLVLSFLTSSVFAHSGRTDSSGGHKDNGNRSGLGGYHYHHGESAHLHDNGICEYEVSIKKATPSVSTKQKTTNKNKEEKPNTKIYLNNKETKFNGKVLLKDKNVYLPLKEVCDKLGNTMIYNSSDNSIMINDNVTLMIDSVLATVNGENVFLTSAPIIENGICYVHIDDLNIITKSKWRY